MLIVKTRLFIGNILSLLKYLNHKEKVLNRFSKVINSSLKIKVHFEQYYII